MMGTSPRCWRMFYTSSGATGHLSCTEWTAWMRSPPRPRGRSPRPGAESCEATSSGRRTSAFPEQRSRTSRGAIRPPMPGSSGRSCRGPRARGGTSLSGAGARRSRLGGARRISRKGSGVRSDPLTAGRDGRNWRWPWRSAINEGARQSAHCAGRGTTMILERIVQAKREEVAARKATVPLSDLKARIRDLPPPRDFHRALDRKSSGGGIRLIAEVKRASPSQGIIRYGLDRERLTRAYAAAGAAAISVLTDEPFFQGSLHDLARAKASVSLPVLRKDFILDPYQVYEARAWGADAILLIVAIVEAQPLQDLLALSDEMGLHPLTEVHTEQELQAAPGAKVPIVGINNRDLKSFQVSLETTFALLAEIPQEVVVVSESGISHREEVARLEAAGVDAILVGEGLLRAQDVGEKVRDLLGRGHAG